jgi:hypothetical protein
LPILCFEVDRDKQHLQLSVTPSPRSAVRAFLSDDDEALLLLVLQLDFAFELRGITVAAVSMIHFLPFLGRS